MERRDYGGISRIGFGKWGKIGPSTRPDWRGIQIRKRRKEIALSVYIGRGDSLPEALAKITQHHELSRRLSVVSAVLE